MTAPTVAHTPDPLLYEVKPDHFEGFVRVSVDLSRLTITYQYADHQRSCPLTRDSLLLAAQRIHDLLGDPDVHVGALGHRLHLRVGAYAEVGSGYLIPVDYAHFQALGEAEQRELVERAR